MTPTRILAAAAALAALSGGLGPALAADMPAVDAHGRPVKVVRVEREVVAPARVVAPVRRLVPVDPEMYDNPHRQIVTDRRCVDDGDGITCRYRRSFR